MKYHLSHICKEVLNLQRLSSKLPRLSRLWHNFKEETVNKKEELQFCTSYLIASSFENGSSKVKKCEIRNTN